MTDYGKQREITLRFLAEPTDINFGGKVHGGSVMKWIDQAAYACAAGWCGQYCVTAYVGGIRFIRPISIGELVEVRAMLIHTGRTSMHIAVDVSARLPRAPETEKATHCIIVFVGVDEAGQPSQVPTWTPASDADRALQDYAVRLMELRKTIESEMGPRITG